MVAVTYTTTSSSTAYQFQVPYFPVPQAPTFSPAPLTDNAITVLKNRYLLPGETPDGMFRRVANHIAEAEEAFTTGNTADMCEVIEHWSEKFYQLMASLKFLPNSPTLFNAGAPHGGCLSACFVVPVDDSMEGICEARRQAAFITKSGGGVGFDFSRLRPRGTAIRSTHRGACGPVAVMRDFDMMGTTFTQGAGAKRKAAMMMSLRCDHPDIFEFIHCKDSGSTISNANISVMVTDKFLRALAGNSDLILCGNNCLPGSCYCFSLEHNGQIYRQIDARDLWREITESAHKTGDPGIILLDRINENNPLPQRIEATNPCLLGSTRMLTPRGLLPISELAGEADDQQFWTPNGWETGQAWLTGTKSIVQVVLSNGQRITTTPDHRIAVGEAWQEAGDLLGERLDPFLGSGEWPGSGDTYAAEDLVRLGFIQGDGSLHSARGGFYVNIGKKDADLRPYFEGYKWHSDRQCYVGKGDRLYGLTEDLEFSQETLPNRRLPEGAFRLSSEDARHFLRGLFSANGSVLKAARRVTLKSTCAGLVQDVQLLLLALGFRPYITKNEPSLIQWPNGEYTSRTSYDLNISSSEVPRFGQEIGFVQTYKTEILEALPVRQPGNRKQPVVTTVEYLGEEEVYDFSAARTHAGWANGLLVHNCGEQPLEPYGSCNLGSINLAKFISPSGRGIEWGELRETVHTAVRFLDDVVEMNEMPTEATQAANYQSRRIGLGVMGWADLLLELGIPYSSYSAVTLAGDVMRFVQREADAESLRLGKERGPFPAWSWGPQYRNSFRTTVAPTGSISIIAGCSSGIEPYYDLEWQRTMEDGTILKEGAPAYQEWQRRFQPPEAPLPMYFQTAKEIAPYWHVMHQAEFQRFVDNGISKTVNLPNSATVAEISEVYQQAINSGCKGVTVYRDGSRSIQVLNSATPAFVPEITAHLDAGVLRAFGISKVEMMALVHEAYSEQTQDDEACPACGSTNLAYEEGCKKCHCGWSAC